VAGLCLVAVVCWLVLTAWQTYDTALRPYARTVTNLPPSRPPSVRGDDPAEVRRWREVLHRLGEATVYRAAKRQDWADAALGRVLELDPQNADARALQVLWALEPAPTMTPDEAIARHRAERVTELVGAATSFMEAGEDDIAAALLREALALDPLNAAARLTLDNIHAVVGSPEHLNAG
jgi:Tfp pilus assembly protein PilF